MSQVTRLWNRESKHLYPFSLPPFSLYLMRQSHCVRISKWMMPNGMSHRPTFQANARLVEIITEDAVCPSVERSSVSMAQQRHWSAAVALWQGGRFGKVPITTAVDTHTMKRSASRCRALQPHKHRKITQWRRKGQQQWSRWIFLLLLN